MKNKMAYPLEEISAFAGAVLVGDKEKIITGLNTLDNAVDEDISFLSNKAYESFLATTSAGCVILLPDKQDFFVGNKLVTENPYYAFAKVSELFSTLAAASGEVHASVVFGSSCQIASDVDIGANVVIGANVTIGRGTIIYAGCYIGDNTTIGENVIFYPNACVYGNTVVGDNTVIHSQVVIGSDGFGFAPVQDGRGSWQKVYQLGGVDIGCNVEIGAGTTIDRGVLDNTVIADGVKLDNQIQIAHNVRIGENTAVAACTGIAGSTTIGKRCTIAGAVGIIGHLTITDDVHITAMTLVTRSIGQPGSYSSGTPMNRTETWRKNAARFNHLDSIVRKL
ncbi:MAG: UDP-3-O-[3-hydroxymyristoyl] glucosamine N-acyltransferase [Candidatus Endobugula sp.]|jgi:UDP-3-O-[3-hydroxymyristoyl] glucosamine N-acyltransferase